jgi:hypothetical protein
MYSHVRESKLMYNWQLWELIFGERLFGEANDTDVLRSMVRFLGSPPDKLLRKCSRREEFFDETGEFPNIVSPQSVGAKGLYRAMETW